MRRLAPLLILCATSCTLPLPKTAAGLPEDGSLRSYLRPAPLRIQPLFGDERFPNVVVTTQGTVLAVFGSSRIRARRSEDGGETFGPETLIAKGFMGGGVTVDEQNGDVLVFVENGHPPAPLRIYRSTDDGRTWQLQEGSVVRPDVRKNVPSMHMNEHGITLRRGAHRGRLIRAARSYGKGNHRKYWPDHYTTAIYSDDGGRTWRTSAPFPEQGTGEATIAELADGTLYYNSRVHWEQRPRHTRRRSARSTDGGASWHDWRVEESLPDGQQNRSYGCMGGLTRLNVTGRDILIFSNLDTPNPRRESVTVWASFDGGHTWPVKRLVFAGPSAYSSLTNGRPGTRSAGFIYLHFESGRGARLARFRLSWLLVGRPTGDGDIPDWVRGEAE